MSRFTGDLAVLYAEDATLQVAMLLEPLIWECDALGSGLIVTIPKGFICDGASVPWFFWWFMPPWGHISTRAAILHDYLQWKVDRGIPEPGAETRGKADWQFYLALKALGVEDWRARIAFWGVTAYSALFWVSRKFSWIPFMPKLSA